MTTEIKYFTNGSRDEPEGLTLATRVYVDGNVVNAFVTLSGAVITGYKEVEITKDQYDLLNIEMDSSKLKGLIGGLVTQAVWDSAAADVEAYRKAHLSVKRVQALIALNRSGTTKPDIYAAIDTLPANQKEEALLWFEDSQNFVRNHPYINALGQMLGYSQTQLDDLFALAETIR